MLTFLIGLTVGALLAEISPRVLQALRARVRGVYTDRHGVLHTRLDGMSIRIGVVPDPGETWEPYTADDAADDLDQVCLN